MVFSAVPGEWKRKEDEDEIPHMVWLGQYEEVQAALDKHPERIDEKDPWGYSGLLWACRKKDWKMLKLLLKYEPNMNLVADNGRGAMFYAEGNKKMVLLLAEAGAVGAIWSIVKFENSIGVVKKLLKKGKCTPNDVDSFGNTLLHIACSHENLSLARYLLEEHKMDPNVYNTQGRTSFQCALANFYGKKRSLELCRLLCEHGADVNLPNKELQTTSLKVSTPNISPNTHIASDKGYVSSMNSLELLELLLEFGAKETTEEAGSILHGCYDLKLRRRLVDWNVSESLFCACEQRKRLNMSKSDMEQVIERNRQDVNAIGSQQRSPLMLACRASDAVTVRLLLEGDWGVDVNTEVDGQSALREAGSVGSVECCILLLRHGASHWVTSDDSMRYSFTARSLRGVSWLSYLSSKPTIQQKCVNLIEIDTRNSLFHLCAQQCAIHKNREELSQLAAVLRKYIRENFGAETEKETSGWFSFFEEK